MINIERKMFFMFTAINGEATGACSYDIKYSVDDGYTPIGISCMKGGQENAVKVVNEDSSKTSSVLFLEKELKRYEYWYGDMDSLSR